MKAQTAKIELLSPAGSFEALMAAIKAGCNAVYFGVEQLNMRARSSNNFTLQDLRKVAEIGKEYGINTYLALNTVLYDHDISLMKRIILAAKESGITAIIASDHAAIHFAHKEGVKVHISTQVNVSNIDTVEFYAAYADTIVLARELSLKQVADITRDIKRRQITGPSGELVRVEIFAHGALCMAISGKCYLSLHSNFASANRGACIQNCRKSYIVMDKDDGVEFEVDNEYIMSAKDLCTIDFLDKILDAGVSVLKIEGRGRSADYVFTVTQCYREAIDAYNTGAVTQEQVADWKTRLATVYNRGFWDGYYLGKKMGEWNDSYGSKASTVKVYIGRGVKYFEKVSVGEFRLESSQLAVGDQIMITGPTTGYVETMVTALRVDDQPAEKVIKGEVFTLPLAERIRPSDKLYKILPA
ncbi:MAG TPA: peptidase U32 family protein [Saprospiraceae bacterium]|nr:peptidase U32 family protein [Saprospiraceae bacterium]